VASPTEPSKPAPRELRFVQDVVNSLDIELVADAWSDASGLSAWLSAQGIERPRATERDWRRAVCFREALRQLLEANNGRRLDPEAMAVVAGEAARVALKADLHDHARATLVVDGGGVDAMIGRVLALLVVTQADGRWERLKACANDGCLYAFYDPTKNRSGRWCTMRRCGTQHASRVYRSRRRASPQAP